MISNTILNNYEKVIQLNKITKYQFTICHKKKLNIEKHKIYVMLFMYILFSAHKLTVIFYRLHYIFRKKYDLLTMCLKNVSNIIFIIYNNKFKKKYLFNITIIHKLNCILISFYFVFS